MSWPTIAGYGANCITITLSGQAGEYDKLWSKKNFFGGNTHSDGKHVGKMANVPIIMYTMSGENAFPVLWRLACVPAVASLNIIALTYIDGADQHIGTDDVIPILPCWPGKPPPDRGDGGRERPKSAQITPR
jgi:hypothetical protein